MQSVSMVHHGCCSYLKLHHVLEDESLLKTWERVLTNGSKMAVLRALLIGGEMRRILKLNDRILRCAVVIDK